MRATHTSRRGRWDCSLRPPLRWSRCTCRRRSWTAWRPAAPACSCWWWCCPWRCAPAAGSARDGGGVVIKCPPDSEWVPQWNELVFHGQSVLVCSVQEVLRWRIWRNAVHTPDAHDRYLAGLIEIIESWTHNGRLLRWTTGWRPSHPIIGGFIFGIGHQSAAG